MSSEILNAISRMPQFHHHSDCMMPLFVGLGLCHTECFISCVSRVIKLCASAQKFIQLLHLSSFASLFQVCPLLCLFCQQNNPYIIKVKQIDFMGDRTICSCYNQKTYFSIPKKPVFPSQARNIGRICPIARCCWPRYNVELKNKRGLIELN